MATLAEIRRRIASVKNTQQITRAMQAVAPPQPRRGGGGGGGGRAPPPPPGGRRPPAPPPAPPRPEDTDWAAIAGLYAQLAILLPSPVVELNRAVAVGMADGPAAGLAIANDLAARGELPGYHLLPAVRADFLRRLGRPVEAADGYRAAIELAGTDSERRYLETRLTEVSD